MGWLDITEKEIGWSCPCGNYGVCASWGVIPASADTADANHHGPINLAIILHMHQPYYKNIESGFYELPWVRVHGSHEYIDSPGILGMYPGHKCNLQHRSIIDRAA